MRWYRHDEPHGRFIGSTGGMDIYAETYKESSRREIESTYMKTDQEFIFSYGPASGMLESSEIDLYTPGEIINHVDVGTDVRKRVIRIAQSDPLDALLKIERINGFHGASHAICFISAIEDAMDIIPDRMMQYNRIVQLECERIRSNLLVIERMAQAAGFGVPVNQLAYLREKVSRIIGRRGGHRYFFGVNSINSSCFNTDVIGKQIVAITEEFQDIFKGILESKLFINRLQDNGVNNDMSSTGPAARASGMLHDARIDSRTLPYEDTEYSIVTNSEKDAYGRFLVRAEEIPVSSSIIKQLEKRCTNLRKSEFSLKDGEGMARVESPSGDLFYSVKILNGRIESLGYLPPSIRNIQSFRESMKGNIFTDFHFNWESYGIWTAEAGVVIQ